VNDKLLEMSCVAGKRIAAADKAHTSAEDLKSCIQLNKAAVKRQCSFVQQHGRSLYGWDG